MSEGDSIGQLLEAQRQQSERQRVELWISQVKCCLRDILVLLEEEDYEGSVKMIKEMLGEEEEPDDT